MSIEKEVESIVDSWPQYPHAVEGKNGVTFNFQPVRLEPGTIITYDGYGNYSYDTGVRTGPTTTMVSENPNDPEPPAVPSPAKNPEPEKTEGDRMMDFFFGK